MFVLGGIGGLFVQQKVVPVLATYEWARTLPLVRSAQERTTIIERTEKVQITEDEAVRRIVAQVRSNIALVSVADGSATRSGTGVFVTGDGVIAVGGSVTAGAAEGTITVFLPTGELLPATHVGTDRVTGVAFVRVKSARENYPVMSFARTQDLYAGQRLMEVGVDAGVAENIFVMTTQMQALATRVDTGTSDAWATTIEAQTTERQRSTVLVTNRGELAALGNATRLLPADAVHVALTRLLAGRSDTVVDLGITYRSVTPMTLTDDTYGYGVVVTHVTRGGRGDKSGLRVGDHITALDGQKLSAFRTLPMVLGVWREERALEMTVVRDGTMVTLTLPATPTGDI